MADLARGAIGAMGNAAGDQVALLADERKLVEWLQQDKLRAIKAAPTAQYFLDMRRAFTEMRRILEPGACCVVVSGKQSTFYRFATREVLYVANSARMLTEEARVAGFEVETTHDVQLVKPNRNARPRSLDDYYETVIVMRNPVGNGRRSP